MTDDADARAWHFNKVAEANRNAMVQKEIEDMPSDRQGEAWHSHKQYSAYREAMLNKRSD